MADVERMSIEELDVTVATTGFLDGLGVVTLGEVLRLPVLRARPLILAELSMLFHGLGVEYHGSFEPIQHEVPEERRLPCFHVTYAQGADGEPVSRIGGRPSAASSWQEWPRCGQCSRPLSFLGQICGPSTISGIELAEGEAIQLFSCVADCSTHNADSGASVAWFVGGLMDRTAEGGPAPAKSYRMVLTPAWDDAILLNEKESDERESAYAAAMTEKLGGMVAAGNDPPPERCGSCGTELVLIAQLGRRDEVPNPSGDTTWIVRACPDRHVARLGWTR